MQLDQTHVKVRLRTMAEIGDLALIMVRRYPAAILVGFAAGAFFGRWSTYWYWVGSL